MWPAMHVKARSGHVQALRTVDRLDGESASGTGVLTSPESCPLMGTGCPGAMRSEERVPIPVPMAPPAPALAQVKAPGLAVSLP